MFPSTTTINFPVIFCHTDTEWNSWPLKNNEEILTIEWGEKNYDFFKKDTEEGRSDMEQI